MKIRPKDSEVCSNQECLSEQFDASGMSGDRGIGTVRGKWKTGPWSKVSVSTEKIVSLKGKLCLGFGIILLL